MSEKKTFYLTVYHNFRISHKISYLSGKRIITQPHANLGDVLGILFGSHDCGSVVF